jgi:hypothetical protein
VWVLDEVPGAAELPVVELLDGVSLHDWRPRGR